MVTGIAGCAQESPSLLLPLLVTACQPDKADDTGTPGPLECTATVAPAVGNVVTVVWSAEGTSRVEYGLTDALGSLTPDETGDTHAVDLLGLPAETEVYWRATTDGVGSCEGTVTTGALPDGWPTVEITVDDPAARSPEPWVFGSVFVFMGGQPRVGGIDRTTGGFVWALEGEAGMTSVDAQFATGGNDIWFNQFNASFSEDNGNLRRVDVRGETVGEWLTPLAHHMFAQLPDGKLAFQQLDTREWTDGEGEVWSLIGDAVAELDPADGSVTPIFSVWDHLEPTWNRHWDMVSLYPDGTDWTHGNALKYDDDTGRYLLSLGHADVLMEFERAGGALVEMYGEAGVPVAEGDYAFDYQHDPGWTEAGTLLMFATDQETDASGAVEYELRDGELHEIWSHDLDDGDLNPLALGQARRLENGNTLISYGAEGVIREVTPAGEVVWEAVIQQGFGFGQIRLLDDWYAPAAGG